MGSSLVLTGGAATTKTLKESISITGHGMTVGDVLRYDPAGTTPNTQYIRAQANSAANAEVLGIVSAITDENTIELAYGGYIDIPALSGISFPVLFLSGVCAGGLTSNPPSAVGQIIKPVASKHPSLNGYILNNYLGTQIGGSSTVGIDEVQPVGTIMPYAGTAIPDSWLECNGSTYTVAAYPELYSKICYTTGDKAPIYGHVVEIDLNSTTLAATTYTSAVVGDWVFIKNHNGIATASDPSATPWGTQNQTDADTEQAKWDIYGTIVSKGTNSSGNQGFAVQTYGKWTQTAATQATTITRRFIMPNVFAKSAVGSVSSAIRVIKGSDFTNIGTGNITNARMIAYNVPDFSGRFPVGVMDASSDFGGAEADNPYIHYSGQVGPIALGAMGGEDRHQLTVAEMPAHDHTYVDWGGTAISSGFDLSTIATGQYSNSPTSSVGNNSPHNNMPPYLAVRYIIKAKPYTRAAIIDGLDLPWASTLVRDLRTRAIGGSNSDVVFYTNVAGDSGYGTPRMWLANGGKVGIGYDPNTDSGPPSTDAADSYYGAKLHIYDRVDREPVPAGVSLSASSVVSGARANLLIGGGEGPNASNSGRYHMFFSLGRTAAYIGVNSRLRNLSFALPNPSSSDLDTMMERLTITPSGNVGIGTTGPVSTLQVNGVITTAGLTSSAVVSCATAPTQDQHLTNKLYVDVKVDGKAPIMNASTGISIPIGGYVMVSENAPGSGSATNSLNNTRSLYFRQQYGDFFTTAIAGTSTVTGTWKCCGGGNNLTLWQRIS